MFKAKAITAIIVTGIFGLAACGGGSSDNDDSTVTTVRQKNAALPLPSMPATTMQMTVTTAMPNIGGGAPRTTTTQVKTVTTPVPNIGGAIPPTTVVKATTTTQVRTVTTPLPKLPVRK